MKLNTLYLPLFALLFSTTLLHAEEESMLNRFLPDTHFQATVVNQSHGNFNAKYSGTNSTQANSESLTSLTSTLFLGFTPWKDGEIKITPEISGGQGLSATKGIAGFPNGEIYRVDTPTPKFNLARAYVKQTRKNITVVVGKFSLNDFFDANTYSHDPRTQFLNWSLMDNGAWDYAADTKGYTYGIVTEYKQPQWTIRFAEVGVPKTANGLEFDLDLKKAHSSVIEWEYRYTKNTHPGVLRLLSFANQAHMGSYQKTLDDPSLAMDITQTRAYRTKYGVGLNLEHEVKPGVGFFTRMGWNNGQSESWAFTEIDNTVSAGFQFAGSLWKRNNDCIGVAAIQNGLSDVHTNYLKAGGYGFIIGDGNLKYAPERILELYYRWNVYKHVDLSPNFQWINNPGYNQDRGPIMVVAIRGHYEF